MHTGQIRIAALLVAVVPATASAQESEDPRAEPIVVTAPGGAMDLDDGLSLRREDIVRTGAPDLLSTLARTIAGVSLQDVQGNPWQPNLVYRGFVASPLQGQAQGLAVYVDGARFNQPFGDTVGFDLIPDAALRSASLLDASPAYGLNALGGSLILQTATGRGDPGIDASLNLGRYGEREASFAGGGNTGAFSYFAALQYREEAGWRDFSPSRLVNGYADLGYDGEDGGLHVKVIEADTDLTGNGVAPVELLDARREAVFSWPDNSRGSYGRISLHPWLRLGEATRFEATLYRQRLKVRSLNGDIADIETCDDNPGLLCLEGDSEDIVLTGNSGDPIADELVGEHYGVLNRGSVHTSSEGVLAQVIDERPLANGTNHLAVGFSYDTSRTDFSTSTELGALTETRGVSGLGARIVQEDGSIAPVGLTANTDYWGLFLAGTVPLGSGLSAEIGLRYNLAKVRLTDRIGTALNGTHRFKRLNPGLELDWRIDPGLTLRAGYAESNRVPTPAELSCADENAPCSLANFFVADPPLDQVVARTWELGASGRVGTGGWNLNWLLSAYRASNRDDIQYVASTIRGRAYFRNIGDTRRQGIELSMKARKGGLQLALGYAFTDATYRSALTLPSPANPRAEGDGTIAVHAGNRLPGIPRHGATLSADYEGALGKRRFTLGGDVAVRSSQLLVGDEGNLTDPVPGYFLANLRGSIELIRGLSLFGEVRNALNRRYATFGTFSEIDEVELIEAPDATNPRAYGPGAPRRWSAGLRARFSAGSLNPPQPAPPARPPEPASLQAARTPGPDDTAGAPASRPPPPGRRSPGSSRRAGRWP